jgi:hypothetical protein
MSVISAQASSQTNERQLVFFTTVLLDRTHHDLASEMYGTRCSAGLTRARPILALHAT